MYFADVNELNIADAGYIHSESWRESHKSFCSPEFVEKHTPKAQADYLRREIAAEKRVFMLIDKRPVGIVSVTGSLIENLYVLPCEQGKGYGTELLKYAVKQCGGPPSLWVLNINQMALRFYAGNGFRESGNKRKLSDKLYEVELVMVDGALGNGAVSDQGLRPAAHKSSTYR